MILLSDVHLTTSLVYISIGWEASYINDINSRIFLGSNIISKMYVYELKYENMISIKFRTKRLKQLTLLLYTLYVYIMYIMLCYVIYTLHILLYISYSYCFITLFLLI